MARIDAWIAAQPEPRPTRPEAIRRLLAEALGKPADVKSPALPPASDAFLRALGHQSENAEAPSGGGVSEKASRLSDEMGGYSAAKAAFEAAERADGGPRWDHAGSCLPLGDSVGPAVFVIAPNCPLEQPASSSSPRMTARTGVGLRNAAK